MTSTENTTQTDTPTPLHIFPDGKTMTTLPDDLTPTQNRDLVELAWLIHEIRSTSPEQGAAILMAHGFTRDS